MKWEFCSYLWKVLRSSFAEEFVIGWFASPEDGWLSVAQCPVPPDLKESPRCEGRAAGCQPATQGPTLSGKENRKPTRLNASYFYGTSDWNSAVPSVPRRHTFWICRPSICIKVKWDYYSTGIKSMTNFDLGIREPGEVQGLSTLLRRI